MVIGRSIAVLPNMLASGYPKPPLFLCQTLYHLRATLLKGHDYQRTHSLGMSDHMIKTHRKLKDIIQSASVLTHFEKDKWEKYPK